MRSEKTNSEQIGDKLDPALTVQNMVILVILASSESGDSGDRMSYLISFNLVSVCMSLSF